MISFLIFFPLATALLIAVLPKNREGYSKWIAAGGAAVVAIYSGKGDIGELRIVARADRRVTNEYFKPFGSGNVVDLPALEWLSRQPEPRLWVSDGCVTGVSDQGCEVIMRNCRTLAKRARIRRVADAEQAIEALGETKARS